MLCGFGLVCAADGARSHHDAALFDDDAVPSFVDRRTASDEPFDHRGQRDPSVALSSPPRCFSLSHLMRPFSLGFLKSYVHTLQAFDMRRAKPPKRGRYATFPVSGPLQA